MKNINIKAVTQITGINENTLRAWERRYKSLSPEKGIDGRRVYNTRDIEKLNLIWKLVKNGHAIGNIANLKLPELKTLSSKLKGLSQTVPDNEVSAINNLPQVEIDHLNNIILALKKFDLSQIQLSLQSARFELSPKSIIHGLILPLMREVGHLVATSQLKVSQEHLLSSLLRDHLGQLYQSLNPYEYKLKGKAKKVMLTTREGDLHEFGILLAAILCRINGYETYYLGPNMPVDDLAEACNELEIDFLVLGLADIPKEKELITGNKFLSTLNELTSKKSQIIFGGSNRIDLSKFSSKRKFIQFVSLSDLDNFLQGNF